MGFDPVRRRRAPEGGPIGSLGHARARPKRERSENVDPTGVEVDADVGLAPSPEEPERIAGAGIGPE